MPTELSKNNLIDEGKDPNTIFIIGNTAIEDAFVNHRLLIDGIKKLEY